MARLRRSNGTFRSTTLADFGFRACETCGRFVPLAQPVRGADGFVDPCPKPIPCPHCSNEARAEKNSKDSAS